MIGEGGGEAVTVVRASCEVLTVRQIAAVIAAQRPLRDRLRFALLGETGMRVSHTTSRRSDD